MSATGEYIPLDLSAYRNAEAALVGLVDGLPLGDQVFQGLPFQIGDSGAAFVGFGAGLHEQPVVIPIEPQARSVVVAHRVMQSQIMSGGPVGETVGTYVFELTDGSRQRIAIRERFEIGGESIWGQIPFRAWPDQQNSLHPRWAGPWGEAGYRQTEVRLAWPRGYWLWCWRTPTNNGFIRSMTIEPAGPRFIIAGVTVGTLDEEPLRRFGAVPVRVEVKTADTDNLEVRVDRGTAGYVWALPEQAPDAFLSDAFAGWGEAQNASSSPAYVEITAAPSATVEVRSGDRTIDGVRWRDVLSRGSVDTERVSLRIVEDGRNWVETVVVDDDSGQPLACRVHFRSPDGVPYQPHGHHAHVNSNNDSWHMDVGGDLRLGQITYAYIDGKCQGWLPRGDVLVDIARGFEYEPVRRRIHIEPGQRRLELRLKRWTSMNDRRWFSGDTHVHFLSTQGSLREAQSEDLNIVNLLQSQWGSLFTNTEDFTGQPAASRDGRTIVWANQENRQHMLGHMILLGLRSPVYPWCSDGPDEAELGGTLETTLSAWADACHAQGGTVILPHFPHPNGEPATLIATGRIDAVEMINFDPFNHLEYYRYLNAGYRLPLVGGTDKMTSSVAVGQYRTYVRIPPDEDFSYDSWCRNLRLGRTFMTGGPLLELSVEGAEIGDTVHLPAGGGSISVDAAVSSIFPVHSLQLVVNGEVVESVDDTGGARRLTLKSSVTVDRDSWMCVRAGGPDYKPLAHHDVWQRGVFAHTSPVYVACGADAWSSFDRSAVEYLLTLVGGGLEYVRHQAPTYARGAVTHHHAEDDHQAFLERPFIEAQAALRRRLDG